MLPSDRNKDQLADFLGRWLAHMYVDWILNSRRVEAD